MSGPLTRAAYTLGQSARVGLFWGQYLLSARLTTPVKAPKPIEGPFPDQQRILRDLRALMARDLANIEAGIYRLPHDLVEAPLQAIGQTRDQRILGAHDDEIHALVARQGHESVEVAGGDLRVAVGDLGDRVAPRCREHRVDAWALRDLPHQGVLAPPAADQQHVDVVRDPSLHRAHHTRRRDRGHGPQKSVINDRSFSNRCSLGAD